MNFGTHLNIGTAQVMAERRGTNAKRLVVGLICSFGSKRGLGGSETKMQKMIRLTCKLYECVARYRFTGKASGINSGAQNGMTVQRPIGACAQRGGAPKIDVCANSRPAVLIGWSPYFTGRFVAVPLHFLLRGLAGNQTVFALQLSAVALRHSYLTF